MNQSAYYKKSVREEEILSPRTTLLDVLDKVLEKGAVINGDVAIKVADVDLIYLGLRIIATSISKVEEVTGRHFSDSKRQPTEEELAYIARLEDEIRRAEVELPRLIDGKNPERLEKGLAKLVLTLVELIRRLTEREAMRRIQRGSLSDIEIQKLGLTFKSLEKKIHELKTIFGIQDEELNLNLGPLGNLL